MKTMLSTFFDMKGIVHSGFIPQGQTVNQVYYVEILKSLCELVCKERPELCSDWIRHHDIAQADKVLSVKNQLLKWHTHHIPLIWLQMTSGCLQNYSVP
jgi:hypothetical protein